MEKKAFKIEEMTCSACASRVERVTKKLNGVQSSVVNLGTEKLTINIDEDEIGYGEIKAAVDKTGYKFHLIGIKNLVKLSSNMD